MQKFNTVEELVDVFEGGKSKDENVFVVRLYEDTNVYEFVQELNSYNNTEKYIVLTDINTKDGENLIGVINGIKDLMLYIMKNFEMDPHTPINQIVEGCKNVVEQLKDNYSFISYRDWLDFKPNIDDIVGK